MARFSSVRIAWLSYIRRGWGLLFVIAPTVALFMMLTVSLAVDAAMRTNFTLDNWDARAFRVGTPDQAHWLTQAEVARFEKVPHVVMVGPSCPIPLETQESGTAKPIPTGANSAGYLKIWRNQLSITPDGYEAWEKVRNGAVVTTWAAARHKWKLGQTIMVVDPKEKSRPPLPLVVTHIAEPGMGGWDYVAVHPKWAEEVLGKPCRYYSIFMLVDDPANRESVMAALPATVPNNQLFLWYMEDTKTLLRGASSLLITVFRAAGVLSIILLMTICLTILTLSIEERKRELATLRAIGGRKSFVFMTILAEAMFLLVPGAIIGGAASQLLAPEGMHFPTLVVRISWLTAAWSVAVAAGLALLLGLVPAAQAASMDPLEAMRTK